MKPTAIDFETEAIQPRPDYPPRPVGVAIASGKHTRYVRVGVKESIGARWNNSLFHNASFDIAVGMEKFGLPFPKHFEDTLYLLALLYPHERTLSLKPSIERVLGRAPAEQNDLRDWILANVEGATKKNFGAFICKAPVFLVEPYARQDAAGTLQLFDNLMPQVKKLKMLGAYEREKALLPMLLENERRGIRVDLPKLRRDAHVCQDRLDDTDIKIRKMFRLKALDVDSGEELAAAIEKLGVKLPLTPTGQKSTDKSALIEANLPRHLKALLLYRSKLAQDLRTFLLPWYSVAKRTGGVIHTHWNQVRGSSHLNKKGGGARTGRMSSEPNFQNITSPDKVAELLAYLEKLWPGQQWPLPRMRDYIVPWEHGWVLYGRDINQQELRLLAHFEEGALQKLYRKMPRADVHEAVRQLIRRVTGHDVPRKMVKILNFLTIYGGGLEAFANQAGISLPEAAAIRDAYFKALPSVYDLMRVVKHQHAIRTLGGRIYNPEPGKDYKLVNYLIQGSAADQIKEIMVEWWRTEAAPTNLFYLQVHDELLFSCPAGDVEMRHREVANLMADTFNHKLGVPFLSDGETGTQWGSMKEAA